MKLCVHGEACRWLLQDILLFCWLYCKSHAHLSRSSALQHPFSEILYHLFPTLIFFTFLFVIAYLRCYLQERLSTLYNSLMEPVRC